MGKRYIFPRIPKVRGPGGQTCISEEPTTFPSPAVSLSLYVLQHNTGVERSLGGWDFWKQLTKAQAAGCSMVTGFGSSAADNQAAESGNGSKGQSWALCIGTDQTEAYPEACFKSGTLRGSLEKPNSP